MKKYTKKFLNKITECKRLSNTPPQFTYKTNEILDHYHFESLFNGRVIAIYKHSVIDHIGDASSKKEFINVVQQYLNVYLRLHTFNPV